MILAVDHFPPNNPFVNKSYFECQSGVYKPLEELLNEMMRDSAILNSRFNHSWEEEIKTLKEEPYLQASLENAKLFFESLPISIPNPEIGIDPDGEFSLEWYPAKDRIFVMSFSSTGEISYAGKFGEEDREEGMVKFNGEIPNKILQKIQLVLQE